MHYKKQLRRPVYGMNTAVAVLALLVLVSAAIAGQRPGTTLVCAGSGTNLPAIRVLAEVFEKRHPEVSIEVPTSIGSTGGIRATADGSIAIGLISRELKENEKELGLDVVAYARTPLVIGVHPSVAEEDINYAEIIDIYRGKTRTWKDGNEIIVLTREPGDSSIEVMNKWLPAFREVYAESQKAKRWSTILRDLDMNQLLAKTRYAIGFSDLGALTVERHQIKPLRVNGVAPTLGNVQEGKYLLAKALMFVYDKEKLPSAAGEFIAFVRSQEGAKILRANGYLPEE